MKKSAIIISSLFLIVLMTGSAFARGNGKNKGYSYNQNCAQYGEQNLSSNLSQEQKDELSALHQKYIDETYELRTSKLQKKQEMQMLMGTSNPDRNKLNNLSDMIIDLHKQIRDKQIDYQLAAKRIVPGFKMNNGFRRGCERQPQRCRQNNCQGQAGYGCPRYVN